MKQSTCGSEYHTSRSRDAKIGNKNPFQQNVLRTIVQILAKPGSYMFIVSQEFGYNRSKVKLTRP